MFRRRGGAPAPPVDTVTYNSTLSDSENSLTNNINLYKNNPIPISSDYSRYTSKPSQILVHHEQPDHETTAAKFALANY